MLLIVQFLLLSFVSGFVPNSRPTRCSIEVSASASIVVVSPPGGVGEVSAVKAASLGSSVRWFVITDGPNPTASLSQQALSDISCAKGELELAGASFSDLTGGQGLAAVSKWCGEADGLICTYDGCSEGPEHKAAICLAVQEASSGIMGAKVAVLSADDDLNEEKDSDGVFSSVMRSLISDSPGVPSGLIEALSGDSCTLRYGELFGKPKSSPEFSPFVGGPKKDPVVTEELTMKSARVDAFVSRETTVSPSTQKTNRHSIGEAAALVAAGIIPPPPQPVSIISQAGGEDMSEEDWNSEFKTVADAGMDRNSANLFRQEMIVDDTDRLSDWLVSKWAPAVLRTYDIAAIRVGARPVYANRATTGAVEIVWQELVDFESVTVGKMVIEVDRDGVTATRELLNRGDSISYANEKKLPGEDVLVVQLGEAASQAIEKGLAKKMSKGKPSSPKTRRDVVEVVTSLDSSGTVNLTEEAQVTGPRKAGARRSTPRRRRSSETKD